ncbi:MAG: helix-turn-helix transcriptional regulator [Clostridia bacterium]|nr:helix-turn-helix transcriptional regulator [Clostridia bacterium]
MNKTTCKLRCFGRTKVGQGWINDAKNGYNRLYYIDGGSGGYVKNGERIPFLHGMLYFIPFYANIVTYTDLSDNLDHTFVGFYLTPPIMSTEVLCLDPESSPYIKTATDTLRVLCASSALPEEERELLCSVTVYLVNAAAGKGKGSLITDKTVIEALKLIHDSVTEGLTVADIAARCHMSTNGFIKKFSKSVGETPYLYIKRLKVRTALIMRSEGASLEEAAQSSGYSDASALLHAISNLKLK